METNPLGLSSLNSSDILIHNAPLSGIPLYYFFGSTDLRAIDQQAIRVLKEQWISSQLSLRKGEFSQKQTITLFFGTWNVNGKLCVEDLSSFLISHPTPDCDPDLYFVGLQEVDLSAEAFLLNDSPREEYWGSLVGSTLARLSSRCKYVRILSKQLAGILLLGFCKDSLKLHVSSIQLNTRGCGVLGFGNKGAVCARIRVHDTSICVVNSHLAAHSEMIDKRNLDYEDICQRISFPSYSSLEGSNNGFDSIWNSDYLFWMGDLNYRISLSESKTKDLLGRGLHGEILKFDQLIEERSRAGGAFSAFTEGIINFPPSYKYDPGTNNFDSSEKRRTPSWCDRILFRRDDNCKLLSYSACMDIKTSDHKPVKAYFNVDVDVLNQEKHARVHQTILRDIDKFENESMPDCKISSNQLSFGKVHYMLPVTREITLENIGNVAAKMRFIPKLEDTNICKNWLWITPPMSLIMPKEKLLIKFTILVDNGTASNLNTREDILEDILIIHLENGKDFFVSITGEYEPTCFGLDLDVLIRLPVPIRLYDGDLKKAMAASHRDLVQTKSLSIPKELWRMVDYLYRFGPGVDDLFIASGDNHMITEIRDCLDTGKEFSLPSVDESQERQIMYIHSMAEALLQFLGALPNPVIPYGPLHQKCIDFASNYSMAKQVVASLPTTNYNVFIYLTSFLRELVEISQNRLSISSLAVVFSAVILRSPKPVKSRYSDTIANKKVNFLMQFLMRQE